MLSNSSIWHSVEAVRYITNSKSPEPSFSIAFKCQIGTTYFSRGRALDRHEKESKLVSKMVGNIALKRFLDRRLSMTAIPTPPIPEGRADHAPLEMLSTVALKQIRLGISQENEPLHALQTLPSSTKTPETRAQHEGSSVRLSPVSSDGLHAPNLPLPHPSQKLPFGDLRMHRNLDVSEEQQQQQVDARKLTSTSRSLSEQNDQSCSSSQAGRNVSSGRVLKPHTGANSQASGKPRCQSSKFCHICTFVLPICNGIQQRSVTFSNTAFTPIVSLNVSSYFLQAHERQER